MSREGLTLQIIRYLSREKVLVEIKETGEQQWVSYLEFRKGRVYADFLHYPYGHDCSFNTAIIYTVSFLILLLALLGAATYMILR